MRTLFCHTGRTSLFRRNRARLDGAHESKRMVGLNDIDPPGHWPHLISGVVFNFRDLRHPPGKTNSQKYLIPFSAGLRMMMRRAHGLIGEAFGVQARIPALRYGNGRPGRFSGLLPMNRKMRSLISNGLCISGSWPQLTSDFWRCPLSMNLGGVRLRRTLTLLSATIPGLDRVSPHRERVHGPDSRPIAGGVPYP